MSTFFIQEYHDTSTGRSPAYRHNILMGNSISAIVAGSDTTRAALISIWYYPCKYPYHAQKIYEEVRHIEIEDVKKLVTLPHLNAVIKETLRIASPVMTGGGSRITGPEGLWAGQTWIPGGTKVVAPKYVMHRRM